MNAAIIISLIVIILILGTIAVNLKDIQKDIRINTMASLPGSEIEKIIESSITEEGDVK